MKNENQGWLGVMGVGGVSVSGGQRGILEQVALELSPE
jgi:hypothetical protein